MTEFKKRDIRLISNQSLTEWFKENKQPSFRNEQVLDWLWKKHILSFDQMSNLPQELRSLLEKNFYISSPISIHHKRQSKDTTIKYALKTTDGEIIEMVLIPSKTSMTVCVSVQVGCSLDCGFCATGTLKRKRNLTYAEIYDQVVLAIEQSEENYQRKLTNIVYMGMGEPMLNLPNVEKSLRLISTEGLGMSPSRITVSTSGLPKQMRAYADMGIKTNFALSLHSALPEIRKKIMPFSEKIDFREVIDALRYWYQKTKIRITYEYIVWEGINDDKQSILALINLCKKVPSKVNLIEYNPVDELPFKKAPIQSYIDYKTQLEKSGITCVIRHSRGKDIYAGCGQLALKF